MFHHAISILTAILLLAGTAVASASLDITGKRFSPSRIYLVQSSLNKQGPIIALKKQTNFLRIFLPAMAEDHSDVIINTLGYRIDLPRGIRVLEDQPRAGDHVEIVHDRDGTRVTGRFDQAEIIKRCIQNLWGIELVLWYEVDAELKDDQQVDIKLTLLDGNKALFTDASALIIKPALSIPQALPTDHFRLWLHYGPLYRAGHYDELAQNLHKAGINSIQIMAGNLELMQAMKDRGFYIIAQRAGSYHKAHKHVADVLEQGESWFAKNDAGQMVKALPLADAVIWDYEPSPATYDDDIRITAEFRKQLGIADSIQLSSEIIKKKYLSSWILFRQKQLAMVATHWANWSRSIKPDIQTILTHGQANVFDPSGGVDYRNIGKAVDIYDPMNFAGINAIMGMKRWQQAAPDLKFAGCQNVAYSSRSPVFISAQMIGMQTLSAALLGNAGTSVYPGQTMDGENFIVFNRVMSFLGQHQQAIWPKSASSKKLLLHLLPKEQAKITLGNGKTLLNIYPDWERQAVARTYYDVKAKSFLAVIANWNQTEPCYAKLSLPDNQDILMVINRENKKVFTLNGQTELSAQDIQKNMTLRVNAGDFAGFEIRPHDSNLLVNYRETPGEQLTADYREYAALDAAASSAPSVITYDDFDHDQEFEYVIHTTSQKVWISQQGNVVRWQAANGSTLDTQGFGLLRDQIYLPVSLQSNTQLDSRMNLRSAKKMELGVKLVFDRTVNLTTQDSQVDLLLTKTLLVDDITSNISVNITIQNTSISMEHGTLELSYRVHNHLKSDPLNPSQPWAMDDGRLVALNQNRSLSILSKAMSETFKDTIFSRYQLTGPFALKALGEYQSQKKILLGFHFAKPDKILQGLRWHAGNDKQGTIEWMYRPAIIHPGDSWSCDYQATLRSGIRELTHDVVQQLTTIQVKPEQDDNLLLHLNFENGFDATHASGSVKAVTTGKPHLVDTPSSKGLELSGNVSLSLPAAHNFNLNTGKLAMRFMPLWDGNDGVSHKFINLKTSTGSMYLRKLADGRLLMNMIDSNKKQHYPWTLVKEMKKNQWHELVITWDAKRGHMMLFLDSIKLSDREYKPWDMGELSSKSLLHFTGDAEAVIDWIKIWDRS